MFDANMRHLPAGFKAVAAVWGCKEGSILYKRGVRKDQYVKFTMIESTDDNPKVLFHLPTGDVSRIHILKGYLFTTFYTLV